MKVKVIDFGYKNLPFRAHENDAGADVYVNETFTIGFGETKKIQLGFGLELPDGYAAFVFPRSGWASQGIVCELPPIDSGYRGEIHAIVTNCSNETQMILEGDRIGQLVVMPIVIANYVTEKGAERGVGAFASTGK